MCVCVCVCRSSTSSTRTADEWQAVTQIRCALDRQTTPAAYLPYAGGKCCAGQRVPPLQQQWLGAAKGRSQVAMAAARDSCVSDPDCWATSAGTTSHTLPEVKDASLPTMFTREGIAIRTLSKRRKGNARPGQDRGCVSSLVVLTRTFSLRTPRSTGANKCIAQSNIRLIYSSIYLSLTAAVMLRRLQDRRLV
jgi:hypothetical protein